jgi:hypothetical protein
MDYNPPFVFNASYQEEISFNRVEKSAIPVQLLCLKHFTILPKKLKK